MRLLQIKSSCSPAPLFQHSLRETDGCWLWVVVRYNNTDSGRRGAPYLRKRQPTPLRLWAWSPCRGLSAGWRSCYPSSPSLQRLLFSELALLNSFPENLQWAVPVLDLYSKLSKKKRHILKRGHTQHVLRRHTTAAEMAVMSPTERLFFVPELWLPIEAWPSAPLWK